MRPAKAQNSPSISFLFLVCPDPEERFLAVHWSFDFGDERTEIVPDDVSIYGEGRGGGDKEVFYWDWEVGKCNLSKGEANRNRFLSRGREGREEQKLKLELNLLQPSPSLPSFPILPLS